VKITLVLASERRRCTLPYATSPHVVAVGACPGCGATPLHVSGTGQRIASNDRAYEADAVAVCCGAAVGTLRVDVDTLFGLTEDEAVLKRGRARVY
jgi:hypothetical protein